MPRIKEKGFTGEAEGELSDDGAGDGESDKERPVPAPLPLEEHRPRIELPHSSGQLLLRVLSCPPSLSVPVADSRRTGLSALG